MSPQPRARDHTGGGSERDLEGEQERSTWLRSEQWWLTKAPVGGQGHCLYFQALQNCLTDSG